MIFNLGGVFMSKKYTISLNILCIIIFMGMPLFAGCGYKGYSGKYADLYTVAINSVLWNVGNSYGADRAIDSEIEVIETDNFGRTLFTYREKYYSGANMTFSALIISQYSVDGYVYYYEDYNYLIKQQKLNIPELERFSDNDIEYLKSVNDWDKEINFEKCIRKEIVKAKQDIPYGNHIISDNIINEFGLSKKQYNLFYNFLTADDSGKFIVYGSIINFSEKDIYFVALVKTAEEDIEEIIFLEPVNLYDYREELIKFKKENGWIYCD